MEKLYRYKWVLLLIPIIIIYSQSINFSYTIDDHQLIVDKVSQKVDNIESLKVLLTDRYNNRDYRPITMLSFGIENWIYGELNPKVSHSVNLFLFSTILFLSCYLFSQIVNDKKLNAVVFISILLFACHPLCVEVVASVKSRDGLLSMFFSIASLIFLIKPWTVKNLPFIILGGILFLLALFSKLDALGVLLFLPLYTIWRDGFNKKMAKEALVKLFILAILVTIFSTIKNSNSDLIEETSSLGMVNFTENNTYADEYLTSRIVFPFQTNSIYLSKIIFPFNKLRYYYGYKYYELKPLISMHALFYILLNVFLIFSLNKLTINRKSTLHVGLIGYISFIFFALNVKVPVAGIVADRYAFMALPWALFVLTLVSYEVGERYKIQPILKSLVLLLIFVLTASSFHRAKAWKSDLDLIEVDAPYLESSYEGMRIAANVYKAESDSAKTDFLKEKYLSKAIHCAQKANEVYPNNALMNVYEGTYYYTKRDYQKAIKSFERAITADSTSVSAHTYLGDTYYTLKDLPNALTHYSIALKSDSSNYFLVNNIGTVYYEMGDKRASLNFSNSILKRDSLNLAALENLGYFYLLERDTISSKKYFIRALNKGMPLSSIPISLE